MSLAGIMRIFRIAWIDHPGRARRWRLYRLCFVIALAQAGVIAPAGPSVRIWPKSIGDYVNVHSRPLLRRTPAAEEQRDGELEPISRRGYLVTGPGRALVWENRMPAATTSFTLDLHKADESADEVNDEPDLGHAVDDRVERRFLEAAERASVEVAPEMAHSPPEIAERDPPSGEESHAGRGILDEDFINWVTRRVERTRVEVPFRLPSETLTGEQPKAPSDRIGVRYRVEP